MAQFDLSWPVYLPNFDISLPLACLGEQRCYSRRISQIEDAVPRGVKEREQEGREIIKKDRPRKWVLCW